MSRLADALLIPGVSSLAAALALAYGLYVTRLDTEPKPAAVTPERAAQDFAWADSQRAASG
jgi:hypothetical protein